MKFAAGELQITAALGTVSVEIQLDKVHKELEPLKDTIEKTFWEASGRLPVRLVAGSEAGARNATWPPQHQHRLGFLSHV